ncbi:hypothetical protein K501DRAFT_243666 [Backusella circina FSU 941]|nr:hypothetical protein K501DRAFT_243666 [Backusella circina FSU 941]
MNEEETATAKNLIYTIVICGKPFNLSWRSLTSDGPENYFTRQFQKSSSRIIHIDRNPDNFEKVAKHLRGYPFVTKDEDEHHALISDAHYYGLDKLLKILNSFVYLNVGGTIFRLKWDLFLNGKLHYGPFNYFTGPLQHSFFTPHTEEFIDAPPIHIQRNPDTFKDMIRHLQGYKIHIRDDVHRQHLLSDAQFYMFKKLQENLKTSITTDEHSEILLHIDDIKPSLFQVPASINGQMYYKRDNTAFPILIQLDDFNLCCHSGQSGYLFLLENPFKLKRGSNWTVSHQIEMDKHCATILDDNETGLSVQQFMGCFLNEPLWEPCSIHAQCQTKWLGVERAITGTFYLDSNTIFLSIKKMQVISSRREANMKRDFLPPV